MDEAQRYRERHAFHHQEYLVVVSDQTTLSGLRRDRVQNSTSLR